MQEGATCWRGRRQGRGGGAGEVAGARLVVVAGQQATAAHELRSSLLHHTKLPGHPAPRLSSRRRRPPAPAPAWRKGAHLLLQAEEAGDGEAASPVIVHEEMRHSSCVAGDARPPPARKQRARAEEAQGAVRREDEEELDFRWGPRVSEREMGGPNYGSGAPDVKTKFFSLLNRLQPVHGVLSPNFTEPECLLAKCSKVGVR